MPNFFERVKLIDDGGLYDELKRNVEEECGHDEDASTKKLTSTVWERFMNCIIRESRSKNTKEKKDPNIAKFVEMGLEPPPDMPQEFKDRIQNLGGTELKLVVQKFIQGTDLTSGHNRLSMSLRQVRNDEFLNEEEKAQLNQRRSNRNPKAIEEVMFVQPCGEVTTLNLSKWEIGASPSYILNGAWHKKVVMNGSNDLKPNAVVQIWSFRVGPNLKLGFAMIKVTDGEEV